MYPQTIRSFRLRKGEINNRDVKVNKETVDYAINLCKSNIIIEESKQKQIFGII